MTQQQSNIQTSAPPRRRRWLKVLPIVLALLILLIALAPAIISTGPVRNYVVGKINSRINGRLSIESWSIGWFSGISLRNVSLQDDQDQSVLAVKSVSLDPSYRSLLGQNPQLGQILVRSLDLEIHLDQDGRSNLEGISTPSAEPKAKGAGQPTFDLLLEDAKIAVHYSQGGPLYINNLRTNLKVPAGSQPMNFQVSCDLSDPQGTGEIDAHGLVPRLVDGTAQPEDIQVQAKVDLDNFDVSLLSPLLHRAGLDLDVAGLLNARTNAQIDTFRNIKLQLQADSPDIRFFGPALQADEFHVRDLATNLQASRQDGELTFEDLNLNSNVGSLRSSGTVRLIEGEQFGLRSAKLDGRLNLNLPRILNQLPSIMRLRRGLSIADGTLSADYAVASTGGDTTLIGTAQLNNLSGSLQDKPVNLDQPLELAFDLAGTTVQDVQIRRFILTSGFANLKANGTADTLNFQTEVQLGKLKSQLAQFIDLGKLNFAGRLNSAGNITRLDRQLSVQTDITGRNLLLAGVTLKPLSQSTLDLKLQGSFTQTDQGRVVGLTLEKLTLLAEQAQVELAGQLNLQPLTGTAKLRLDGDLARIAPLLAQFVDLGKLNLTGQIACNADLSTQDNKLNFQTDLAASELLITGLPRGQIREPKLTLNLRGTVLRDNHWNVTALNLDRSLLAGQRYQMDLTGQADLQPLTVSALVKFSGDLARMRELASVFRELPGSDLQAQGRLDGSLKITTPKPRTIACAGTTTIKDLLLTKSTGQKVSEPSILIQQNFTYNLDTKSLAADLLDLQLTGLATKIHNLSLTSQPDGRTDIQARTTFQADLAQLAPWMTMFAQLEPGTQIAGKVQGSATYSSLSRRQNLLFKSQLDNLSIRTPGQPPFADPKITIDLKAATDPATEVLELNRCTIASSFLQANGHATSGLGPQARPASVSLQADCNLQRLSQVVRPWRKDFPELIGSGRVQVDLTGTPKNSDPRKWLDSLRGTGLVTFDTPQKINGLALGPATVNMQVEKGLLTILPTAIPANEGQINLHALINLSDTKPFLTISEPADLLQGVHINAEMSDAVLKYVNPIFANNNQVSGVINFRCNRLIIDDRRTWKKTALMTGLFSSRDLQLQSRGGLIKTLGDILGLNLGAKLGEVKPIGIQLDKGIVSYKDMHIVFSSTLDLSFSGQVGLDETLKMRLGLPVVPAMVGNNREWLKVIGDRRIYIPITGTISRPQLDAEAIPGSVLQLVIGSFGNIGIEPSTKPPTGRNDSAPPPPNIGNILEGIFQDKGD